MLKPKRVVLFVDSEENLLKIQKGIKLLQANKKDIAWVISCICDIDQDPSGFDYALQECVQTNIDVVIAVSNYAKYASYIFGSLKHKFMSNKIYVVLVILGISGIESTRIFQDIISGNLPEMEYVEFKKTERLAPYEIIRFLNWNSRWKRR